VMVIYAAVSIILVMMSEEVVKFGFS